MDFLKKNKSIIIAIVVILIVNIGLIFGLVIPLYEKVQNQKDSVEQQKYQFNNIREEGQKWQEYQVQRERFESNKELIENSLVKNDSQINLIERLEKIAEEENVLINIENIEPLKDKKKNNDDDNKDEIDKDAVMFSLTLDGEYNEILDYLYKLENLNYILNILSVDIKTRSAIPALRNQVEEEENKKPLQAKIIIFFTPQE